MNPVFKSAAMRSRPLFVLLFLLNAQALHSHESAGHPTHGSAAAATIGTELYLGKRGYLHSGVSIAAPVGRSVMMQIGAHVVREENGAREVPSFEAELIGHMAGDLELELYGFGYPEIEGRQAWGAGLRASKRFSLSPDLELTPFFGPTFAHVRAGDEVTGTIEPINHTLLLGGVTLKAGELSVTLMGSHSIYDRDPAGLETPVDLESMTHFAAYENNDGFARNSLAVEASWNAAQRVTFNVRYAAIWFDEETRHAVTVAPSVQVVEHVEWTVGVQFLRGGNNANDLFFTGLSVAF